MSMKTYLKEPALHFVFIGLVVFIVADLFSDSERSRQINITADRIARMRAEFERSMGCLPKEGEIRAAVTAHIDEEVMYREALALGLDIDDQVVRRRMVQKMEVLFLNVASLPESDDNALATYLKAHRERYLRPARVSFQQVYLRRSDGAKEQASI